MPSVCGGCQKCVGQLCVQVYETTEAYAEECYGQIRAGEEFIQRQLLLDAFSVALACTLWRPQAVDTHGAAIVLFGLRPCMLSAVGENHSSA